MAGSSRNDLIGAIDALHARVSRDQRRMLALIAEADRGEVWRNEGARDMAHWLSIRYGISWWKASRWIAAAHALEALPRVGEALGAGELSADKVVELTRFAAPETEANLVRWAKGVSPAAVRRKADLAHRLRPDEVADAQRTRFLTWWFVEDSRRVGLEAELPAAEGAVVTRTLERLAARLPRLPGEEDGVRADARRADALVALCSSAQGRDGDPDRATVVVHARLEDLAGQGRGSEVEGGGIAPTEAVRRLVCSGRLQAVIEDAARGPVGIGRLSREPSHWMMRQLRYRDQECRFPGCGSRRFTQAHHIVWWSEGGRTDLDNLLLVCSFHHRLAHEYHWTVRRDASAGTVEWFRPDGSPYRAGPAPPASEPLEGLSAS